MYATTIATVRRPHAVIPAGTTGQVRLTVKEFVSFDPPVVETKYHVVFFPGLDGPIACKDDQVTLHE